MNNRFRKNPILQYESRLDTYPNTITPAKNHIPDWYKKIPLWADNEFFKIDRKDTIKRTVKACVPFLEAFTLGYIITLPYDLYIKMQNGHPVIVWPGAVQNAPGVRDSVAHEKLVPFGHHKIEFTWNYCVAYTIPKGYSAIVTHPLNRHDLPFTTVTGVVDGGLVLYAHGKLPFYIKKDFEGLIPQGTPIAQIIPFRQENWFAKLTKGILAKGDLHNEHTGMVFKGWYKNAFWKKKRYE
jgi:hypothetical protein